VPLEKGWLRLIVGNACPKGLVEDERELKVLQQELRRVQDEFPNIAQIVSKTAFKPKRANQKVH
jgi:hypothetical protein